MQNKHTAYTQCPYESDLFRIKIYRFLCVLDAQSIHMDNTSACACLRCGAAGTCVALVQFTCGTEKTRSETFSLSHTHTHTPHGVSRALVHTHRSESRGRAHTPLARSAPPPPPPAERVGSHIGPDEPRSAHSPRPAQGVRQPVSHARGRVTRALLRGHAEQQRAGARISTGTPIYNTQ